MRKASATTTNTSSEPEKSEESAKRAAAADAADRPLEPEISEETPKEKTVHIDPAQMHALTVQAVKGLILRIDLFLGWKNHPDDQWCETTTTVIELLLDKYFGMTMGPEAALAVQLGSHTIANVDLFTEPKPKPKETKRTETETEIPDNVWPTPGIGAA
jgi:hypothetical protein